MTLTRVHPFVSGDTGPPNRSTGCGHVNADGRNMQLRGAVVRCGGWRWHAGGVRARASEVGGAAARVETRALRRVNACFL